MKTLIKKMSPQTQIKQERKMYLKFERNVAHILPPTLFL